MKKRIPLNDKFVRRMRETKGKNCGYRDLLSFLMKYPEWFELDPKPNLASKSLPKRVTVKVMCGVVPKLSFENPHGDRKEVPSIFIRKFFDLLMDNGALERE